MIPHVASHYTLHFALSTSRTARSCGRELVELPFFRVRPRCLGQHPHTLDRLEEARASMRSQRFAKEFSKQPNVITQRSVWIITGH